MELGPIFRAMTRNKIGVGLIILEIAATLAIVLNCYAIISGNRERMSIPTGMAEDEIFIVQVKSYGESFADGEYLRQIALEDMRRIQAQPGVISASIISPLPLINGGSSTQQIVEGASKATAIRCPTYSVTPGFLQTMGLELAAGRGFNEGDVPPYRDRDEPLPDDRPPTNVIITQDFADALFPDGNALGKRITSTDGEFVNVIVGIVDYMYTPYDGGRSGMETRIFFFPGVAATQNNTFYMVRADKDAYAELFTSIEEDLLATNSERVATTQSMAEWKEGGVAINRLTIKVLSTVAVLLMFITGLGIFGMTSFSVAARTRQIGTRRALGATRQAIVRYFLVENSITSLAGIALGLVLAFFLNRFLIGQLGFIQPLGITLALSGFVSLWLLGLLASAAPALRAARIPPIIATKET